MYTINCYVTYCYNKCQKFVHTSTAVHILTIVSRTGSSNVLNSWSSASLDAERPGTVMSPSNPSVDYKTETQLFSQCSRNTKWTKE